MRTSSQAGAVESGDSTASMRVHTGEIVGRRPARPAGRRAHLKRPTQEEERFVGSWYFGGRADEEMAQLGV
jgi:hypothetical protein